MKHLKVMAVAIFFLAFWVGPAFATTISLSDWAFNIDGSVSEFIKPTDLDDTAFDWGTGLGTLTWETTGAGAHSILAFFDHDIDENSNGYLNEFGATNGTPASGQSWEIDEPGYEFVDIYDHVVLDGKLDLFNDVPSGSEDDVSMAMGWDFTLETSEMATINFILGLTAPTSGFYLSQTDTDSGVSIYFSSLLTKTGGTPPPPDDDDDDGPNPIPEPGTVMLLGAGIMGLVGMHFRKRHLK
jgi:hypothetical protein